MSEFKSFSFRFEGRPMGKPTMTQRGKHRPALQKWWVFKNLLMIAAKESGYRPGEHEIRELNFVAFMTIPKSWSKAKRTRMAMMPHQVKPDLSNIIKAVEDALTHRDQTIHTVAAVKVYEGDDQLPGFYIELTCKELENDGQR